MRPWHREALLTLAAGTVIGLVVLGLGGRLAMAGIQVHNGGASSWSLGGTLTVIMLGGVSGLAGAAMWLVSAWIARRVHAPTWTAVLLLAVLLGLVTMRGLRGTPPIGGYYFYPLVAIYAVLLALSCRFLRVSSPSVPTGLPSRE